MRRSFVLVTTGVGTWIGWVVAMALGLVVNPPAARVFGTVTACLFVGTVFEILRSQRAA